MATEQEPNFLQVAFEQADLTLFGLWLRYVGLGGTAPVDDVHAHLRGIRILDPLQHDTLVQALNERFMEQDMNHPIPYERP
jgi:hypothetical protein